MAHSCSEDSFNEESSNFNAIVTEIPSGPSCIGLLNAFKFRLDGMEIEKEEIGEFSIFCTRVLNTGHTP